VTVFGTPQPGGSKKAFVNPRTKQANVVDANPKAKPWQTIIAQVVGEAMEVATLALLPGPLAVEFDFYRARPAGHFGTGRNAGQLKGSAPPWPTTRPDVLKLARAVEDALTGVTWRDDAEIVVERLRKHYGEPERVEIRVWAGEAFEEYLA
jgi:Holliday junction resolvase RusA-like endonuclease